MAAIHIRTIIAQATLTRIWFAVMWLIAGWTALGAAALYLWELNWATIAVAVLGPIIGVRWTMGKMNPWGQPRRVVPTGDDRPRRLIIAALVLIYLITAAVWIIGLAQSATVEAIRSPWIVVPVWAIVAFAIATLSMLGLIWQLKPKWAVVLISVQAFLALSVTWLVYQIGYGFDPFIHQKAEEIIAATGSLLPKTPYYLGQYALVVMANKLFGLPIAWVDKLIGPTLFALMVPAAYVGIRNWSRQPVHRSLGEGGRLAPTAIAFGIAATLLIPLGQFIVTTPQGLGYVWFVMTVMLGMAVAGNEQAKATQPAYRSLGEDGQVAPTGQLHLRWYHLMPFALAALATHPIAGIPAMSFVAFLAIWQANLTTRKRWTAMALIGAIAVFGIPLAFAAFGDAAASNQPTVTFNAPTGGPIGQARPLVVWHPYSDWLSTIDLVAANHMTWLVLLAVVGLGWAYRKRDIGAHGPFDQAQGRRVPVRSALIPVIFAVLMAMSAGVWKYLGDFNFLIAYERADYPERLLTMAIYALLPLVAAGVGWICWRMWNMGDPAGRPYTVGRMTVMVGLTILITANVYTAYPRFDRYQADRGYSTSAYDFQAVRLIDKDADNVPYVVLSNQAVSAAAIKTFGFEPSYNSLNRYPVPTGGPLYQVYLKMVYDQPTRANTKIASDLTGVKTVYFVLNDYWYQSEEIKNVAEREANGSFVIGGGTVNVFKYVF